jgi:hypothetical protein
LIDHYGGGGANNNNNKFQILAFPCNQFGGQEPGTHEEILEFVKTKFDPDIDQKLRFFEKADVNGANAREVYSFLKPVAPNEDGTTDVRWNFGKFVSVLRFLLCVSLRRSAMLSPIHVVPRPPLAKSNFLWITKETRISVTHQQTLLL